MLVSRGFAFVDLCGFTAFTEEHGVQETVRVLSDFRNRLRAVASRRSVRLAKWLGDGAMIVAVEPAPLVDSLLEIAYTLAASTLPLEISAGGALGSAILFEGDDYISSSVNLAAHLCHVAGPGEVLLTPNMAESLPPWAAVVDRSERAVAGFTNPVPTLSAAVARAGPDDQTVIDPVCGLALPASACPHRRAAAGSTFLFCSDACLTTWESRVVSAG
ncbi:MAG TPA: adenylate/guanylate cyclase domain-containing protein [Acidimicrobiales bacterium]|jgi:class 3 adenylate cyclase/YHS domain-containing protein|nr:adenylate/guanylate cyclase domain-containing protein [Acidimicrobiales bacterium]